jgi:tetratricopeptide (TPR) repeat protein
MPRALAMLETAYRRPAALMMGVLFALALLAACKQNDDPNQRGLDQRASGDLNGAISTFEGALVRWPDNAELHYNLALTWQDLGVRDDDSRAHEQAVNNYARALSLSPDIGRAHTNRAIALAKLGRDDEALAHYDEALRQDPDDERARGNRGNLRFDRGDLDGALADYERLRSEKPDMGNAHFGVARIHRLRGDDAGARTLANHARTLTSDDDAIALIDAFLAEQ